MSSITQLKQSVCLKKYSSLYWSLRLRLWESLNPINLEHSQLELVEDWDDEQEAVFRRQDVMPALQAGCKIELRVTPSQ